MGCSVVAALCLSVGTLPAASRPPVIAAGPRPVRVPMRRVVLLHLPPPEASQPLVRRLIAAARAKEAGRSRRAAAPHSPVSDAGKPTADTSPSRRQKRAREAEPTINQLRAVADALFADDLTEQLRAKRRIAVIPAAEVTAAEASLRLTPAEAAQPDNAARLCRALKAEALLFFTVRRVAVREADSRDAALWAEVSLPYRRETKPSGDTPEDGLASALPAAIPVSGAGSAGRKLFRSAYVKSQADVLREATARAAAQAVCTLRTGIIAPLAREKERVAVAPVLAPSRIDKLLFSETGRKVVVDALRDLSSDVSTLFAPDLLPQFPSAVPSSAPSQHPALESDTPALWLPTGEGMPDTARVQAFGRRLHVDYVLLARITDIELESGPPEEDADLPPGPLPKGKGRTGAGFSPPSQRACERFREGGRGVRSPGVQTDARAEAVGALVRVADGALLWHDRATAAMEARPSRLGVPMPTDRQIVGQAERFALLELQRSWRRYRLGFEQ